MASRKGWRAARKDDHLAEAPGAFPKRRACVFHVYACDPLVGDGPGRAKQPQNQVACSADRPILNRFIASTEV